MNIDSINKIKQQLLDGNVIYTKAQDNTGKQNGCHVWRPILEDGEVVDVGCYGHGQGWRDQEESFYGLDEALEQLSKYRKRDTCICEDAGYGDF